jgi:Tfp pilus assembly protein PilN
MKPMLIDFAGPQDPWRRDLRMPGTRLALLLALGAVMALAAAWQQAQELTRERLALESRQARLAARQQAQAEQQRRAAQASGEHLEVRRKAVAQRALPWEAIFRAFESAPAARLESWAPDLANGVVKVQAHAHDIAQVQDYLAALQGSPVFKGVTLQRHELPPQGGGVNFTYEALLAAQYRLPERLPETTARSIK